jgi:hypothetical protein
MGLPHLPKNFVDLLHHLHLGELHHQRKVEKDMDTYSDSLGIFYAIRYENRFADIQPFLR